ncbi:hypothetical protein E8D34_19075 [Nocardioides sp. GY 10113]|uniref:hypothetical protein n=1 Tax=Nocardioides sp. GY 10113 TaxID=2569761 RepID=UPI0010A7D548|nr:hypothetical protein [Nocardioides sp. GY 10113]TIC80486.1 hypothetical protein E8D34_19075 [Nocardioides sp. GY 10113]
MKDLRRLAVAAVIVSFSVAALLGIGALLGGGALGTGEARVLTTTVIVGTESMAALCYLALAGHRFAAVGALGGAFSVAATLLALWLTWGGDDGWRAFGVTVAIAASLAQASLLLRLADRRAPGPLLALTMATIAAVALLLVIPIIDDSGIGDGYWRLFGVVAILDVLGTVVVAATSLGRRGPEQGSGSAARDSSPRLLSVEVERRVAEEAARRRVTPSQLVSDALDSYPG